MSEQDDLSDSPVAVPSDFGAPFDDADADLILRSSDLVDFHVYKVILAKASPVFKAIFNHSSLPTPDANPSWLSLIKGEDWRDGLPVLCLSEGKEVLHSLLTAIFPVSVVIPGSFMAAIPVLSAAQKYEMDAAMDLLRNLMAKDDAYIVSRPDAFRAYCLAWHNRLGREATTAAQSIFQTKLTISNIGEDLRFCPGPALRELWKLHGSICRKVKSASKQIKTWKEVNELWGAKHPSTGSLLSRRMKEYGCPNVPWWYYRFVIVKVNDNLPAVPTSTAFLLEMTEHIRTDKCNACASRTADEIDKVWCRLDRDISDAIREAQTEFTVHANEVKEVLLMTQMPGFCSPFNHTDADVILRSSDGVDFRVHTLILSIASPFFRTMFTLPQTGHRGDTIKDPQSFVAMSEDAIILKNLLMAVYHPAPTSLPTSFETAAGVLAATQKYEMDNITLLIRTLLRHGKPALINAGNAVRAYALANKYRLANEALIAARLTLSTTFSFEVYFEDLAMMDGASLYELSLYRKRCQGVVLAQIEQVKRGESPSSRMWLESGGGSSPQVAAQEEGSDQQEGTVCVCPGPEVGPSGNQVQAPKWWYDYIDGIATGLSAGTTHPTSGSVVDRAAIRSALDSHVKKDGCTFCLKVYIRREERFCTMLEGEIDGAIEEVPLNLPWEKASEVSAWVHRLFDDLTTTTG